MRGYQVVTSDDRAVGHVSDVRDGYLIVESGWLRKSRHPVPREFVHAVDEAAKAFVKLRDGANAFTLEDLRAFLTGKLGKHELPAALDFVDELPRTPVGKLSRHELRMQQPVALPKQAASGGRP